VKTVGFVLIQVIRFIAAPIVATSKLHLLQEFDMTANSDYFTAAIVINLGVLTKGLCVFFGGKYVADKLRPQKEQTASPYPT